MDYCQTPLVFSKVAKVNTVYGRNLGLPLYWLVAQFSLDSMSPSTEWTEQLFITVYPWMSWFATSFTNERSHPDAFLAGMASSFAFWAGVTTRPWFCSMQNPDHGGWGVLSFLCWYSVYIDQVPLCPWTPTMDPKPGEFQWSFPQFIGLM